ncbi:right-handed parallel beta-helix repeat-containing protein, partial [Candidatus Pacearchaeota archaeon]|nr:right-handed parallel beta-helix repeat-containing protein [Candidatus Pacearchaeota archaeon]
MVHKQYIWKNGKRFGPYYYESYREGTKVKKRYIKNPLRSSLIQPFTDLFSRRTTNQALMFLIIILALGAAVYLFSLIPFTSIGNVALEIGETYTAGDSLGGVLRFTLQEGELIPADSLVQVSLNDYQFALPISTLVSEETISGKFFGEGTALSGDGAGYGLPGDIAYSELSVDLRVYALGESAGQESASSGSSSDVPDQEEPTPDTLPEEAVDAAQEKTEKDEKSDTKEEQSSEKEGKAENAEKEEKTEKESDKNSEKKEESDVAPDTDTSPVPSESTDSSSEGTDSSDSGSSSDSSSSSSSSSSSESSAASSDSSSSSASSSSDSGSITGQVISEESFIVTQTIHAGEETHYMLEPGQNAELVAGSVRVKGKESADSLVELTREGRKVILHMASENEQGFGEEFLGPETKTYEINLSAFLLTAQESGTLRIELLSQGETLLSLDKEIGVEQAESNESVEALLNETLIPGMNDTFIPELNQTDNETLILNQTGLRLIQEIPTLRIQKGESVEINLSNYFAHAEHYSIEVANISASFADAVVTITPDTEFSGARSASITASAGNESINSNEFTILVSSGAVRITTGRDKIKVGEPVRWVKNVSLDVPDILAVQLPAEAINVSVTVQTSSEPISTELAPSPLTASVISDLPSSRGIFSSLARITGNAVDTAEQGLSTAGLDVVLDENATEYVIEYYTPGPEIQEEEMKDGKLVAISAPDELGYTDVIASMLFNSSEKISDLSRLKLYWRNYESNDASTFTQKLVNEIPEHALVEEIDSTRDALAQTSLSVNASVLKDTYVREEVPFDAYDLDGDGNYDLVEWVVPHLSNQSYEFIYITDAIHLDENRIELGNIYDAVRYKDGNWSEPIPATHYVRVAFEQNLTNRNDITLYARNATPGASVQVYTINGDELIADFGLIDREQEYKVYLTNLEGEEDMFDLQVTGGLVEFDYIVDPIPIGACGILSTGGETYILNNNISTGNWGLTQCIKITANSITLDGNGYTINETGSVSIGVLLDEVSSVTVKNLNLANFPFAGIQVKSSALNNILNNKVYSSVNSPSQHEHGVLLYPSPLLNTVANNTLRNGIQGVFVFSLSESQGGQNIITNNSINTNRHGIHIRQVGGSNVVSYNYVYNNGPGDVQIGVGITVSSSSNTLLNNTLWGNEYGYHLYGGTGNLIHGGRVSDSSSYGILIDSGTNILRTISLNGSGSEDIRIGSVGGGSTTLIDMHPSPYSFQSLTHKLILNETGKGGIMFNDVQLVDRSNLSADVHIGNNTLVVVSGVSALNLSANLTLLQLAPRPGANYSIFRDNVQCAVHACTNLTALNLTNVSFIVTGSAGNYSIQQSDDQSAPDITINFPANRTYNATPLNFNVSLSENGTAEYTITNGVINISMQGNEGTFGTSFNASNNSIRDGSYTLRVYANDTKGNAGTANVTFFIDTQYPNITYVNQTETDQITLNRLSILVNVTAEDAFLGNITIRLYNTTTLIRQNVSTTSPFFINYSYLLDGTYRFNATASDTSGNVNHTPTRTVYLDALSPLITINFPANRTYNSTPLNFNVSLSKNGTVLYSLNGGIVNVSMSSTDNKNFNASNSSIRDGSYTFRVYSNDTLGNRNDTANIIFFVDTQYPNISYQSPSESDQSILGRTNIMVNVTAEDAFLANITIRLYNSTALIRQNFSTNASFFINYTSLLDGVYRFNATASDTSGNVNHTSTRSVTVDALSPLVTINFPANRTYNSTPLNFNVSTNKNTTVFYSLDSGINNVSMSSTDNRNFNASNSSIINGSYTFIVYANDTAGNRNDTSRVIFFIDTGYPKIDYLAATESDGVILQTRRDLIVNITSNDTFFANITIRLYNGSHSRIRLNESNLSLFMINYTGLSDGLYFFNATASDTSGNVNHTSSRNVTVDLNAPHVLIVFPANQTYTSVISALNYSAIDFNLQACWYTLDNGVTNTTLSCGTNVTSLNSGDGSATWRVYANDTNGKVNSSTITFFVDSVIPPSISFVTPTETTGTLFTTRNNTLINVSATDTNLANITIRLYNTTSLVNESFTTASVFYLNITNLSDGIYFFNATAVDTAGNTNSTETRNVTIDVHAPVLTVNFPGNQSYAVYTLNFNASLNENGTVLYTLDEGLNNRTMTATDNQNYIATNNSIINGGYRIRFYSNDTAGNRNDTTFVDFSFQNLNLTVCQNLTVDDSNYIVSQEITTTTSCFLVTANNIVLEGAGYSLSGDRSGIDYGIHVRGAQNVTIQNINVTNFNEGILLNLTNISLLSNVSVSYNVNTGIVLRNSIINELFNIRAHNNTYGIQVLASSSENLLRRVNASNNSQVGILINASSNNDVVSAITHMNSIAGVQIAESSSGNELSNVDSRHTVFGILINASSENVIGSLWSTNNTRGAAISNGSSNRIVRSNLSSNSQYGISFTETAASNTLEASETRLNTLQGIFVNGSHNNITLSLSEYNSLQGIYLAPGVQNTTISGTSVARNLKEGVYLNMSHNNTLRNNTIINHSSSGLYLMESRDNTFSGNNVSLIRFFVADETVPSSGIGIVLIRSPSNTFSDNVLEHNQMAFVSNWSNDLSFTRDQFKEGVYGGVFTSSNATRFNKVHFENFADGELGDIGYGLVINASADTNISFSTFVSNYRGLLVYHSRNLTVENSSFNNNNRDGFILDGSYNATILGSSMTGNGGGGTGEGSGDGLRLLNSSFTTLRYSTFVENYGSAGLYLHQSHNNTIVGVTTRSQYDDGIALLRSHNNTFVNTTGVSDGSLGEGSGSSITLSSSLYNVFVNSTTNYSDLGVVLSNANYTFFAALTSIGNDDGLSLTASHNNTFAGVTATSNTDKGISLSSSFNNTFVNSTTNLNIYGFYLSSSSNNTFLNATAVNNTASGNDGFAVYLESNSTQNSFYNTTIANTAGAGITISSSAYTIFKNASITSSRKDAISLQGASSRNTTFDAVFVSGTNASFFDIDFESASINYTLLLDTHLNRYNFTGVGGIVYFSDTNEGDLFFLATLNGTGQNLSLDIAIGNNSIFANSSQPGLNRSANITLYGIGTGFINPAVLRDGVTCLIPACNNFTSLNAGTVRFNISGFSTYSIGESAGVAPDTSLPAVYLQAPLNGSSFTNGNVSFNATFADNFRLANATFYLWNASALVNTTFRVLDGISNSTNISVALPHQGTFFWNYRVADNSSNYAFNHTN